MKNLYFTTHRSYIRKGLDVLESWMAEQAGLRCWHGSGVDLGIRDIGIYYPADPGQHATFRRIAAEALPQLRTAYAT